MQRHLTEPQFDALLAAYQKGGAAYASRSRAGGAYFRCIRRLADQGLLEAKAPFAITLEGLKTLQNVYLRLWGKYGTHGQADDVRAIDAAIEAFGKPQPASWKAEVVADRSGTWAGNLLRFATQHEAEAYATDLGCRWMAVRHHRTVESADPVNYVWSGAEGAQPLKELT